MGALKKGMLTAFLVLVAAGGAGAQEARLLEVSPQVSGEVIVCHLRTVGLPSEKQLQSMQSGLESAVDLELALEDERGNLLGGRSMTLRLAFDLWEQFFSVRGDGAERRFDSVEELRAYLAELKGLEVAARNTGPGQNRFRLRVGLTMHAVAPEERARVAATLVGEHRSQRTGQDTQEASVSLGRVIRFFYKGEGAGQDGLESRSGWFTIGELSHATD